MIEPAIKVIVENSADHPEFSYYIPLMEKAERNLLSQPDICIEICKSLLEGVSKSIILDQVPDIDPKKLDEKKVSPLIKWACQLLRQDDNVIEDEFARRVAAVAEFLGILRNERGDVSHGKPVPKLVKSDDKLATMIFQVSSGLLTYMLDGFFTAKRLARINAKSIAGYSDNADDDDIQDLKQFDYEHHEVFNNWLDEQFPYEGKLAYSFALYSLYYEDYLIKLEMYQESLDGESV